MICFILALFASVASFNYKTGEQFSYTYSSHVELSALDSSIKDSNTYFDYTCTAKFTVISLTADGAYLQLDMSDVSGRVGSPQNHSDFSAEDAVDELFNAPLYFRLKKDGSITDVVASKTDSEEVLNIKTAVAFSLRSHLNLEESSDYSTSTVIDTLGKHTEYSQVSNKANGRTVTSFFSDSDFVGFADRNLDSTVVAVDGQSAHIIDDGKILGATSTLTMVLNKREASAHSNEDEIKIVSVGNYTLTNFKQISQGSDKTGDVAISKFLASHLDYALVPHLREAYYLHAFTAVKAVSSKTIVVSNDSCPSPINFCRSVDQSWTVGDTNIGLDIHVWALVGVTLGCDEQYRSYMAGAYGTIDILVLSKTLNAVDVYAEYGQVNGVAKRNAVSVSLFGYSLYHYDLPYFDCVSHTKNLGSFARNFSVPYSVQVYIVTLTFSVNVGVNLQADLVTKICVMQFNASVSIVPKASISLGGGAQASVAVAKAGIDLTGSVSDHLDPTAYIDGNLCRVGFYAYNYFEGLRASLTAWYQIFNPIDWIKHKDINFGQKHTYEIWSYNLPSRKDKIIDKYWGATSE